MDNDYNIDQWCQMRLCSKFRFVKDYAYREIGSDTRPDDIENKENFLFPNFVNTIVFTYVSPLQENTSQQVWLKIENFVIWNEF